jgi:hypothetical protein
MDLRDDRLRGMALQGVPERRRFHVVSKGSLRQLERGRLAHDGGHALLCVAKAILFARIMNWLYSLG